MAQSQVAARRQQGQNLFAITIYNSFWQSSCLTELQLQYQNYKNNLQQIAQKIGDVEQETEEHK